MNQKSVLIRLNLDKEDDRKAWEYLQNLDKTVYKSYNVAFVAAVNDYFTRQKKLKTEPFLMSQEREDAFLQRVLNAVERGMQSAAQQQAELICNPEKYSTIGLDVDPEQSEMNREVLSFLDSI